MRWRLRSFSMPSGIYEIEGRILGKVKTVCLNCNKDIFTHFSREKQYCNRECYEEYIKKNHIIPKNCKNTGRTRFKKGLIPWNKGKYFIRMQGKNNPSWKNGNTRPIMSRTRWIKRHPDSKLTKIIQRVYEDNIKRYGTLTCDYCKKEIIFGKDNLEHKIPFSRGGKDEYSNLTISCESCNRKKRSMTAQEYIKLMEV
jgi:5-methylcytosine-specific restriction endonuclease McrA